MIRKLTSANLWRPAVLSILSSTLLCACGNSKQNEIGEEITEASDTVRNSVINVGGQLFSVPSPFQTTLFIKKRGILFDKSVLIGSGGVNSFTTDYSRSLNLGVYLADLGYVSLYEQTEEVRNYLAGVKQLADNLGVANAFDITVIERLQKNITSKDSVIFHVGNACRNINHYLKKNQRTDITGLILLGGWIESMYFSVSAYKSKPDNDLKLRIAEQKMAVENLIKILSNNNSRELTYMKEELKQLSEVFDGILFQYKYKAPITDSVNKLTYINSTTKVDASEDQIIQISNIISAIRYRITGSNP